MDCVFFLSRCFVLFLWLPRSSQTKNLPGKNPSSVQSQVRVIPNSGFRCQYIFFKTFLKQAHTRKWRGELRELGTGAGVQETFAQASQNSALHGHAASFPVSILPASERIGQRSALLQALRWYAASGDIR